MSHEFGGKFFDSEVLKEKLDVESLHGIGKYAADSWKIFVDREIVDDVQDKELVNYVNWAKSL